MRAAIVDLAQSSREWDFACSVLGSIGMRGD
jgi:hypothetical protein